MQEPHTINKAKIAVLSAILVGVQKERLVTEVGIIKRILIPDLKFENLFLLLSYSFK